MVPRDPQNSEAPSKLRFLLQLFHHPVPLFKSEFLPCLTAFELNIHIPRTQFREGNGTSLQYSCLENPRDRGAWWAAIYGVAQSRTRLKRRSSRSSSSRTQFAPPGSIPRTSHMGIPAGQVAPEGVPALKSATVGFKPWAHHSLAMWFIQSTT